MFCRNFSNKESGIMILTWYEPQFYVVYAWYELWVDVYELLEMKGFTKKKIM